MATAINEAFNCCLVRGIFLVWEMSIFSFLGRIPSLSTRFSPNERFGGWGRAVHTWWGRWHFFVWLRIQGVQFREIIMLDTVLYYAIYFQLTFSSKLWLWNCENVHHRQIFAEICLKPNHGRERVRHEGEGEESNFWWGGQSPPWALS